MVSTYAGGRCNGGELAAWLAEHSLGNRFGLAVVGTTLAYDFQSRRPGDRGGGR